MLLLKTLTRQHRAHWICISHRPFPRHHSERYPIDDNDDDDDGGDDDNDDDGVFLCCDGNSYGLWRPPLKLSDYECLWR